MLSMLRMDIDVQVRRRKWRWRITPRALIGLMPAVSIDEVMWHEATLVVRVIGDDDVEICKKKTSLNCNEKGEQFQSGI